MRSIQLRKYTIVPTDIRQKQNLFIKTLIQGHVLALGRIN